MVVFTNNIKKTHRIPVGLNFYLENEFEGTLFQKASLIVICRCFYLISVV